MSIVRLSMVLMIGLAGCAESSKPIVSVTGTITFTDGQRLPAGTRLAFHPADGAGEAGAAVVAADGTFEAQRASGRRGLPAGKYTVLLRAPEGDDGSFFKRISGEYIDGGVLTADVHDGMAPLTFQVARKTAKR